MVDEEGTRQVDQTMSGIVSSVIQVNDLMKEIAAASAEQDRGITQIAMAVTEMDTITQQNSSLVQESSAAATSPEDQSTKLQEMVDVFRLPGTEKKTKQASKIMPTPRLAIAAAGMAREMEIGKHSNTSSFLAACRFPLIVTGLNCRISGLRCCSSFNVRLISLISHYSHICFIDHFLKHEV